jgi:glycosyltransferase involved in cell wall biosynthesis
VGSDASPASPSGGAPPVSVVIASNRELDLLDACLASIEPQCRQLNGELVVCRAGTPDEVAAVARARPGARFVAAPPDADIPVLRGIGLAEARGALVALTEDHCVAADGWLQALVVGARDGAEVVGGGMGNARRERAVDCAAYFAEYGFFDGGRAEEAGARPLLTGANVAYARSVVADVAAWAGHGEWENVAHQRLAARGARFRFIPAATIRQNKRYELSSFCVDRYEHGFEYARKRLAEERGTNRWVQLLKSAVLPAVLTWRVAGAAGRQDPWCFLRALPVTIAFLGAWSVGEAAGYLKGPAVSLAKDG